MKRKALIYGILLIGGSPFALAQQVIVPLGGNTWSSAKYGREKTIGKEGIENWTSGEESFTTYIRFSRPGTVKAAIEARAPGGTAVITVKKGTAVRQVTVSGDAFKSYDLGEWAVKDTGYTTFRFSGLQQRGCRFAAVRSLTLDGDITKGAAFVKNDEGNFFYWGRRGPSVHLGYELPGNTTAEWFYNEVTVPAGNDIIGSYYMANGFGEGYFGMQVNSSTERRILFSVWSPYETDDPRQIPEDHKILLLAKGAGVHTGEFGNEGSGGQSYLRYAWKAGDTCRFLLHAVPAGDSHTVYTAYFFDVAEQNWRLIASFKRPQKATYLTRLHSFLENFIPQQGDRERRVLFSNQWIRDTNNEWHELCRVRFTHDNTARAGYRMDYGGGTDSGGFYLRNCGFFNEYTPFGKVLEREPRKRPPAIDFSRLPLK